MLTALPHNHAKPAYAKRVGLAWLAISAVVLLVNLVGIIGGRFPDPDDIMRLLQVRDLLGGQAWLDLHQYRVDAPSGGVLMHWSRFVDIPLALVIMALTPIIGSSNAELVALTIVPLMSLGLVMLLTGRIVAKTLGEAPIVMTCIAIVLSVPLLFQLAPMRIDHHGWQIIGGLVAVNGIMARKAWQGGLVAGLAMAAWLSISLEGLPLAAAICALMAWRWWQRRSGRLWLGWVMAGLSLGSVFFYLATKDARGLITFCDAIGPAHIAMFVWGTVVLGALAWINPASRIAILAGFAVAGGGAIAILLAWVPECAGSNFSRLDPILIDFWYERVGEGLPIWRQPLGAALQIIVFPLLGIAAALRFARKTEGAQRQFWQEYCAFMIAAFLVAMLVARAGALAAALAAVPMGWQIADWLRRIREMQLPMHRVMGMIALIFALAPVMPVLAVQSIIPEKDDPATKIIAESSSKVSSCKIAQSAKLLAGLPQGEIFAPLDISPRLLLETHHSVVATGHHRGEESMVVVIETLTGSTQSAKGVLQTRGSRYVALCPDLHEVALYSYARPDGFAADLMSGQTPDWLEPIELESESGLKAWRVKSD